MYLTLMTGTLMHNQVSDYASETLMHNLNDDASRFLLNVSVLRVRNFSEAKQAGSITSLRVALVDV